MKLKLEVGNMYLLTRYGGKAVATLSDNSGKYGKDQALWTMVISKILGIEKRRILSMKRVIGKADKHLAIKVLYEA